MKSKIIVNFGTIVYTDLIETLRKVNILRRIVMIRLFLVGVFLFWFFVFSLFLFVFLFFVGLFSKNAKDRMSYAIVSWALRVVMFISGTKLEVKGLENVPKDRAVLFVGNHRSFFDIVINYSILPPLMGFISKKEIKKVPILCGWMKRMNCLFLDRENIKEGMKTIIAGTEKLKNGISMFIYPEGTRAKADDEMIEFKEGSFKMAEKSGAPIVPVAINNSSACFEDQFPRIKKAHVIIEYGKPIETSELSKEEKKHLGAYVHDIVKEMVMKNKELI